MRSSSCRITTPMHTAGWRSVPERTIRNLKPNVCSWGWLGPMQYRSTDDPTILRASTSSRQRSPRLSRRRGHRRLEDDELWRKRTIATSQAHCFALHGSNCHSVTCDPLPVVQLHKGACVGPPSDGACHVAAILDSDLHRTKI